MTDPWNGEYDRPRPRLLGVPVLKVGQVVISQGDDGFISKAIQRATDSIWSHAFVVTGHDELVEAWFPRCRAFSVFDRIQKLESQGRRWEVLDYPNFVAGQREKVANAARSFIGRGYDVRDILHFAWKGRFRVDSGTGLFCFRLVCEAYRAAGVDLFPRQILDRLDAEGHPRVGQLAKGYPTGPDLFDSALVNVSDRRAA